MLDERFVNAAEKKIELTKALQKLECEQSLAFFVKTFWIVVEPGSPLEWNWHLDVLAGYLQAFHEGKLPEKRLIINVPPGCMKSTMVSVMLPAWIWTVTPEERILTVSAEQGLAIRDNLKMKQVVTSDLYKEFWGVELDSMQNEKTHFTNTKRGFRQGMGISSAITGRRGTLQLIDDPNDAKQTFSDVIRQSVNDTFDQSLVTRVNDPTKSGIILIQQRLHESDLTGHLLKKVATKWTHLKIPMLYKGIPTFDGKDIGMPHLVDPRTQKGELMFKNRFTKAVITRLREDLGEYGFSGQLQQDPQPTGGGIIKSFWWRIWAVDEKLPHMQFTLHSWDTAFSDKNLKDNAYSACTRLGVFYSYARKRYCVMILGRWYGRCGYDELRAKVKAFNDKFKPDTNIIENKSTGISLIQDFKRASSDVPVHSYTPGKGEDKVSRAYSVSPIIESGICYVPFKDWAIGKLEEGSDEEGYIHIIAKFLGGDPPCADLTDTLTAALIYLRRRNLLGEHDDDVEPEFSEIPKSEEYIEDEKAQQPRRRYYA